MWLYASSHSHSCHYLCFSSLPSHSLLLMTVLVPPGIRDSAITEFIAEFATTRGFLGRPRNKGREWQQSGGSSDFCPPVQWVLSLGAPRSQEARSSKQDRHTDSQSGGGFGTQAGADTDRQPRLHSLETIGLHSVITVLSRTQRIILTGSGGFCCMGWLLWRR